MPYLTSSDGQSATTGAYGRLGVGVPGHAHPTVAPADWAALTRPGTPVRWVALDVARGPGARPDPSCRAAVADLRTAGIGVLGRLDAAHGDRTIAALTDEARRLLDWYGVDGFYVHRCPGGRDALPGVRRLAASLRAVREEGLDAAGAADAASAVRTANAAHRADTADTADLPDAACSTDPGGHRRTRLVLAPGVHPSPGHAEVADQLVTFCGAWPDYRWSQAAQWTADYPADRFCHLVHGVPLPHLEEAARIARWQGAGTVYFTDRMGRGRRGERVDPWGAIPGYWDEIVSRLGPGVSE